MDRGQIQRTRSWSKGTRARKKERAEGLPRVASAYGVARADSALSQERKAGALVHADLAVLGHFVHRFAAFRFPLTEEVDRYFRSLLQFRSEERRVGKECSAWGWLCW